MTEPNAESYALLTSIFRRPSQPETDSRVALPDEHREAVISLARRTGIWPATALRLLAAHELPPAPDRLRQRCRAAAQEAARTALKRQASVREVFEALAERDVQPVALKGLHLAAQHYADPVERSMSDVDLWIAPAQLAAATRAFLALGFELPRPVASLDELAP
ncbi:MAG TPA: nucleotidyltransferase family protein, partial [Pseudomonadales bacterium]|nr:nucleotidyltransferase family protein [Pseudomonadales bacterium]